MNVVIQKKTGLKTLFFLQILSNSNMKWWYDYLALIKRKMFAFWNNKIQIIPFKVSLYRLYKFSFVFTVKNIYMKNLDLIVK